MRKILFLLVLLCAMTTQRAWAQQAYITDVVVIGDSDDDDAEDLYHNYEGAGWIGKVRDLNDGAGGHYIHLMYKTNNSPQNSGTPINDFYLWAADSPGPASFTHMGRTYYRVGCDGDSDFRNSGGDLNCKADGKWIYLYYTKDATSPVRCHFIQFDANPYSPCNAVGLNGTTTACNLNMGAGGDIIYMHVYKHLASSPAPIYTEAQLHDAVAITEGAPSVKLMNDINLSRNFVIGDIEHDRAAIVTLDLNGHTLNRGLNSSIDLGSVIRVEPKSSLTINDSSDNPDTPEYDGTGTITGGKTNQDGGGIVNHGTLTVNGANIKGNTAGGNGGGIFSGKLSGNYYGSAGIDNWPEVHINGAVIENCSSNGNGGGFCQGNLDGTRFSIAYIKNSIIRNNVSKKLGGGIYNDCLVLEVTNCTISVNTAFDTGGVYNGHHGLTLSGCNVTGNIGTNGAGGIANETSDATMEVSGCTVTDNFAGTRGGGLWNSGKLMMDGNTVTGNIASGNGGGIYNATTLEMKGSPVVTGNTGNDTANNLYLDNNSHITVTGAFNEGTSIGISAEKNYAAVTSGYTTHNEGKDPAGIFTSDKGYSIVLNNNEVYQWYISDVATDAEIQAAMEMDGIVTLTEDITLSKQLTIGAGRTVTIDLNGHKLQRNVLDNDWYNMVIHNFGTLTIKDSKYDYEATATNGQITGGRAHGGGGIYCEDGSKLFFNGGTITGNTATTRDGAGGIGGAIFVQHGAEATINGGVITGNSAERGGAIFVAANGKLNVGHAYYNENSATYGGCIYNEANGTLNFNGGFLKGNSATYGGCVYNEANGTLNIHTCYISNNTATSNGGGILNKGNLYMHPGFPEVHNNTANGISNNLYLDAGTKINVTGEFAYPAVIYVSGANVNTAITSGYSTYNAGLRIDSYFKPDFGYDIYMKDNELYLGVAKNVDVSNEAQLFAVAGMDTHITLTDDITLSKQLTINAGRTVTIDLNGHKLQRNVTENAQYNMVIDNFGSLTIDDGSGTNSGQITGGRAVNGGGICCEAGSTLTFTGGTITSNTASNTGGGIYVKDGATATVTGGVITGNTAIANGGGIYHEGTLNMQGNPIVSDNRNGTALNNVYLPAGKTVNVTGAFTQGASIGISAASTNVAFTSGYKKYNAGKDPATVFTDDNEDDDAKITLLDTEVYLISTKEVNVASYTQLMAAVINNANIKLTADITLSQEVTIQNNKIVTIDLNGHTLNRNLTTATDYGHVLTVASGSQLIINDSSDNPDTPEYDGTGVIKGAYTANGGAIDNAGTLIFNTGTIRENQCTDKGAAIWNRSGATATITGGVITGNTATNNGAAIWNEGTLCMQGNPIVSDNKNNGSLRNLYLCGGKPINLTGALTEGADIGFTLEQRSTAITSGFNTYHSGTDPATFFKADNGFAFYIKNKEVYQINITEVNSSSQLVEAAKTNAIITMTADIALVNTTKMIVSDKSEVTLDLNGHTLRRKDSSGDSNLITIYGGSTLTINDSSDNSDTPEYDGTGGIAGGWSWDGGGIIVGGTLIFNSGTIRGCFGNKTGGGIFVYSGAKATINGGIISGNSGYSEAGGGIYNEGTLTISGNAIISSNSSRDGGGIYNKGTLNISGGSIKDNQTTVYGGGGISNHGTINMTGGSITRNKSKQNGGGIWNGGKLNMKGNPVISGNTDANADNDVYLSGSNVITVTGAFTEGAHVGLRPSALGATLTSGYSKYNAGIAPESIFFSNYGKYLELNNDGEVVIYNTNGNWIDNRASSFSHVDGSTYYIENETELALLAYNVNNGTDYQGCTIVLNKDLDLSKSVWTPIGTKDHPFKGNFDGKGHKISFEFGSKDVYLNQQCALFYLIENADIRNLALSGSIYSSAQNNASFVVTVKGNLNHITNCVSNVSINSNRDGDCSNGGFVGLLNNHHTYLAFLGCAFFGELVGEKATNWGGFIGWRNYENKNQNSVNFWNCLFAPANVSIATPNGSSSRTFCRSYDNTGATFDNSYYTTVLQKADGGKLPYKITAGEGVTVAFDGSYSNYNVSGIIIHDVGFKYKNVLYAGSGDKVNLKLSGSPTGYYHASTGVLTGNRDPYTLTMGSGNCVIKVLKVIPPTTIASLSDWNNFQELICDGYDYAGQTVTLATDEIVVSTVTGSLDYPFRGTFDGGGHKITLAFGSPENYLDQECALFYGLENATIQNLIVDGSIYSRTIFNGGLAVNAKGESNLIRNCVSRVSINNSMNGVCYNGGFIGLMNHNGTAVSFEGCAFVGELVGEKASNWGGFVGWREYEDYNKNYVTFTDCLFAPANVAIATPLYSNSRTFCPSREEDNKIFGASYDNCYYTTVLQEVDGGSQVNFTTTNPVNMGEVKTDYGLITVYANGMKCNGRYHITAEIISLADNADNSALISEKDGQSAYVMLSDRKLYTDGNWNTICLPFDVTLEGSNLQGAEARTLSEATFNNGTLTLNFSEPVTKLTAGTPYILKMNPSSLDADLVIRTADDWDAFAKAVNDGNSYRGKLVVLDADIVTETMVGTSNNRFKGTLNGCCHTLTFNATADDWYCAPFHYVENADIKNLHVKGTINTSAKFAAGIVGHVTSNVTISNCRSSIVINSSVKGDGTHGGFVAMTHNENTSTTLTDCLFDGSINGAETNSCGGMIGWNDCKATFTNCVVRPASIALASENNATFGRGNNITVNNCYYSENLPGASGQGTAIGSMTNEQLAAALGNGWLLKNGEVLPDLMKGVFTIINPVFGGVTINAAEPARITPGLASGTEGDGCVTFCGIYDPVTIGPDGDNTKLYFSTNNTLYWPNGAMTINPFRAYLQLNSTAAQTRSIVLNIGDETTEIEVRGVKEVREINDDAWYDMSGRKLDGKPNTKGVFIHGGRKVVIK